MIHARGFFLDKGTLSTLVSLGILALGLLLPESPLQAAVLTVGLLAFSGGFTNSLAAKMLFDRVPGLAGSGVIPRRFEQIRSKLQQIIMAQFFDPKHLRSFLVDRRSAFRWSEYLKARDGCSSPVARIVAREWKKIASPEFLDPIVDRQIEKLLDSSLGGFLLMMGPDNVKPPVRQFVAGMVDALEERVVDLASRLEVDSTDLEIDEEKIVEDVRSQVEALVSAKLGELGAEDVKEMTEEVIRDQLGWLVVWGNVVGGILGVVAVFLR